MFEWDENKRATNLAKHGIDFVRAARIFQNPVLEKIDDREDYGERRIISAWKAGADEQQYYQQAFSERDHEA